MANYNLTNQTISSSFQQLLQKDTDTGNLVDGVGNVVDELIVTSSYAVTASYAENVVDPTWDNITNKPSGLVSGSSQVSYPELSNIPSGIISSSDQLSLSGSDIYYNNQSTSLSSSNVQAAITELDMTKASINSLSSNLIVYPTTEPSSISGYFTLVASPEDDGYNTTAANVPTGTISGSDQFIAALATTGSLFVGNPGVINLTTVGNVRRTGGGTNSSADFYFEVYKRSGSVETLIATSTNTTEVNAEVYEQFFATALLNNGTFTEDDVIVMKYYGNLVNPAGADPSFDFQFGGAEPIRTLIPVPASVITDPALTLRVDNIETYVTSSSQRIDLIEDFTASQELLNTTFATTGSNTFTGTNEFNDNTTFNAAVSQFTGSFVNFVGGNIETYGGRVAGTTMGNTDGSSTHTGSFVGDGSGLTNIPLDARYATTGSNTFDGNQFIYGDSVIQQVSGSPDYPFELRNGYVSGSLIQMGFFKGAFSQAEIGFIAGQTQFQSTGNMSFNTNLTGTGNANNMVFESNNISLLGSGTNFAIASNTNIQQSVTAPDPYNQKDFVAVSNASVGGKAYTAMDFTLQDYGGDYEDVFVMEAYDGFSFNYGAEFALNGKQVRMESIPSGSGYNNRATVNVTDNYNGNSDINIISRGNGKTVISGSVEHSSGVFTLQNTSLIATSSTDQSRTTILPTSVKTQDGTGVVQSSLETAYGGKIGLVNLGTSDDFGLTLQSENWGYPPNWSGPSIYSNNPAGEYPAIIGFQNKTNWTDGRVTVLKPLVVSGSVDITETMKMVPQDPLPSGVVGELAVSGSNLFFYNGSWTQVV